MQVIDNLLSNAIKYSPQGSTIRIGLAPEHDYCELTVTDQGIGMSPEQVEHIFEKFYRVNISNAAIPGTGLGMTIVKYLVDAHHGLIAVDSKPGAGTTVRIRLPRKQPVV
jgi:signal transduction histidine kinase